MENLKRVTPLYVSDMLFTVVVSGFLLWGADIATKQANQTRREQTDRELQLAFGISSSDINSENKIASCQLIRARLQSLKHDVSNRQAEYDLTSQFESENGSEPGVNYQTQFDASRRRLSAAKNLALKFNCNPD